MSGLMFKTTVKKNNKTLLIYIPQTANVDGLKKDDEVVCWIQRTGVCKNADCKV